MNIKVAIRVRPFNLKEQQLQSKLSVDMVNNKTILFSQDPSQKPRQFTFDYSFWSHDQFIIKENSQLLAQTHKYAGQKHVFKQMGASMVQDAWKGYNCCLIAYGQRGTGKSYSMFGEGSNKGIVALFCEEMFELIAENSNDRECEVEISMCEVYNEKIWDLIPVQPTNEYLKIKQSEGLGVYVEGLSKHHIHDVEETHKLISEGFRNKLVQATKMSQKTSRSNTFLTIYLQQTFKQTTLEKDQQQQPQAIKQRLSVIQFVHLADSSKMSKTGVETHKEVACIAKGLSALGLVICALTENSAGKKKMIPYRDSKVTWLLKNSLGGNCHTYMLCCIAPGIDSYAETLSTLRYGDRVRRISNHPVINGHAVQEYEKQRRKSNNLSSGHLKNSSRHLDYINWMVERLSFNK